MKPDQLSARTRHDRNESIETAKRGGLNVSASMVVEDLDIAKDEPQPSLKLNKNESTFKKESTYKGHTSNQPSISNSRIDPDNQTKLYDSSPVRQPTLIAAKLKNPVP